MKIGKRLYLVRHGQVQGYDGFPVYGHTDVDLTEVGIMQIESLSERLRYAEIHEIYSSDLKRSLVGARIIARHHDVPLYSRPEFREVNFGAWEGLSLQEIRERYPEELSRREMDVLNFAPPLNGESINCLAERVMTCFRSITACSEEKNILLLGHGVVNRVILCSAMGLDFGRMFNLQQDYGCLNIIDYYPDRTLVRLVNG
ncbi:MAG: histidine phosphatase family protein [Desulfobacterales bacterium]|nr:histidine phosphatase family protein [Desulfobacterales bacterium]